MKYIDADIQQVLDTISRHCPSAMSTYLHCLNRSDQYGEYYFTRKEVTQDMSESWAKFLNSIRKLSIENILEWNMIDGGIAISLICNE